MKSPLNAMQTKATAGATLQEPEANGLRIWLRLLACHNQIEQTLRNKLRKEFDTTLPRFDMLAQLERHPEGLRMQDLSRLLMVTGGNITGLTDRMVDEGLLERREDPTDRRAYRVCLTAKGAQQFSAMAQQHAQWVGAMFEGLDRATLDTLTDALDQLKHHLK